MNLRRLAATSALTAAVGAAGLLGLGAGTAAADPGWQCDGHGNNCPQPGPDHPGGPGQPGHPGQPGGPDHPGDRQGPGNWQGPGDRQGPGDWQHRGVDQGRRDHQPFNWNGQQVNPMPAGNGHGWGFWFLGMWIPL
jgi:hypothetical protein